jgi:hypothetical protein
MSQLRVSKSYWAEAPTHQIVDLSANTNTPIN